MADLQESCYKQEEIKRVKRTIIWDYKFVYKKNDPNRIPNRSCENPGYHKSTNLKMQARDSEGCSIRLYILRSPPLRCCVGV